MGAFPGWGLSREELERAMAIASGRPAPVMLPEETITAGRGVPPLSPEAAAMAGENLGVVPLAAMPPMDTPFDPRQAYGQPNAPAVDVQSMSNPYAGGGASQQGLGTGGLGDVRAQQREVAEQRMGLARQAGELASDSAAREAQIRAAGGAEMGQRYDRTAQRVDERRGARDQLRQAAYGNLMAMQQQLGNPPSTTGAEIMGLLAGALAASGRGGAAALAGGFGNVMMRDFQRWQQGVAGYEKQTKLLQDMMDSEDAGMESELRQEKSLSDLLHAQLLNGVEMVASNTKSQEAKRLAEDAAQQIREKYLAHQEDILERGQKLGEEYWLSDQQTLLQGIQAGQVGSLGQKIYAEKEEMARKQLAGALELQEKQNAPGIAAAKTQIDGLELRRDARTITEKEQGEARAALQSEKNMETLIAQMKKFGAENTPTAADQYEGVRTSLIGILNRKEADAGVLNPSERKNYEAIVPPHRLNAFGSAVKGDKDSSMLGAPFRAAGVGLRRAFTDEDAVLDSILERSRELTDTALKLRGYARAQQKNAAGGAAGRTISAVDSSGKRYNAPDTPESRALAKQRGWRIQE